MPNQGITVEPEGEAIGFTANPLVRGSKASEIGEIAQ